jgi:ABC-type antimicrobial peptide transport system permease subunit
LAEVVGVAGDVRYRGLDSDDTLAMYYSFNQRTAGDLHFAVSASGNPSSVLDAVRRAIVAEDPHVAVYNARTMEKVLTDSTWRERLWSSVLVAYAAAALALAAVGIFGVVSYLVARRTRELGIRISVGASGRDILKLVQGELAKLLLAGCLIGLAAAAVLGQALSRLAFGAAAFDAVSFALAAVTVLLAGLGAGLVPALRAARTNPLTALGSE